MGRITPIVLIVLLTTTSCTKSLGECLNDIFFPDIFCWSNEYYTDGIRHYDDLVSPSRFLYLNRDIDNSFISLFGGINNTLDDFDTLYFGPEYPIFHTRDDGIYPVYPVPFDNSVISFTLNRYHLFIQICQKDKTPFKEGKNYDLTNSKIIAKYNPVQHALNHTVFDTNLLSCSFSFKSSYEWRRGKVLCFDYSFDLIVTNTPTPERLDHQTYDYPSLGDTIKITNGHYVQALWEDDSILKLAVTK